MRPKFNFLAAVKKSVPKIINEKLNENNLNILEGKNSENGNIDILINIQNDEIIDRSSNINGSDNSESINDEPVLINENIAQKITKKNRFNIKNAKSKSVTASTIISNQTTVINIGNKSIIVSENEELNETLKDSSVDNGVECLNNQISEGSETPLPPGAITPSAKKTMTKRAAFNFRNASSKSAEVNNSMLPSVNESYQETPIVNGEGVTEEVNTYHQSTSPMEVLNVVENIDVTCNNAESNVSCNESLKKKIGKKFAFILKNATTRFNTNSDAIVESQNIIGTVSINDLNHTDIIADSLIIGNISPSHEENVREHGINMNSGVCDIPLFENDINAEVYLENGSSSIIPSTLNKKFINHKKIQKKKTFNIKNAKSKPVKKSLILEVERDNSITERLEVCEEVSYSNDNTSPSEITSKIVDSETNKIISDKSTEITILQISNGITTFNPLEERNHIDFQNTTDMNQEGAESQYDGSLIQPEVSVIEDSESLIRKNALEKSASQKHKFNVKNALTKDTFKSPTKAAIEEVSHTEESATTDADKASVSSITSSRNSKRFILKNLSFVEEDDSIDVSQLSLKSLINLAPKQPPPMFRAEKKKRKSIKDNDNESRTSNKDNLKENGEDQHMTKFRVDSDGNIVIDKNNVTQCTSFLSEGMEVVVEDARYLKSTYNSFIKRKLSGKRWTLTETDNFYKALFVVGTNFYAMESIFEGRTRNDLKKKFKVEEKLKPNHINYILMNPQPYNLETIKFDSHIPKAKSHIDAVKRRLKCAISDDEEYIAAPKKRKFSLDPTKNGLNLADGDVPSYF